MKLIIALIQPYKRSDVKEALRSNDITKMTVTNALGCGQQAGYEEEYRGVIYEVNLLKKVRVEIAVTDEFVQKTTEQYYDEEHRQFLADRYITGTCPKCGYENAYGDQCEKCGRSLSPKELINPNSSLRGHQPVLKETKHCYFPMNNYETWLNKRIIHGHKDDW